MKTLLTITLLFICSLAFGQKVKAEPQSDTVKIQLTEEILNTLNQLNKENEELQKDPEWILLNTRLQAVQQKQLALVIGFQQGKEVKGTITGIKEGKLLILRWADPNNKQTATQKP